MPGISNIQLSAQKLSANKWKLTATYKATFSAFEVANFNFRDSMQVWEDDPVDDDMVTGSRDIKTFNPSATTVTRTKSTEVSGDALDTELGGEEIYVKIRLANIDLNTPPVEKKSGNINLAP